MYELNENCFDIQNEYINFLDKKYIFRKLDNMSQLKILTYLLPYEIHRLSKKTYTKPIYKRKDQNHNKNINLFFKNMRLSYKFIYHTCINDNCNYKDINFIYNNYQPWKRQYGRTTGNGKNKFFYGFCDNCEKWGKRRYEYKIEKKKFNSNGKCLLLASSDEDW